MLFEVLIFPVFLVFFARASRHFSLGAGERRLPGRRGNGFVLLVFGRVFLESLIHRLSHGCLGFVSIVVGREVERAQSYIQTFVKSFSNSRMQLCPVVGVLGPYAWPPLHPGPW